MNVVFLHGVAGSAATYGWLPEQITGGRHVVRLDFRGHGLAERTPGRYSIDDYGEDVVRALRALDGPAVLVGHSLGGVAAWWTAQRHPDLVAGAFLEDPPLYLGEPDEHSRNTALPHFEILRDAMIRWQADGMELEAAAARIAAAPYGPDPRPRQGEVLTAEAIAARAHALLHADPGVLDAVLDGTALVPTDTASPVTVPVTILARGEAMGPAFAPRHAERLASTHPGVTITRLDGAGHSIHDERAHRDGYTARLAEFLAAVEQRQ